MRLATIQWNNAEVAGIKAEKGLVLIDTINGVKNTAYKTDMMSLIQAQEIPNLTQWYNAGGKAELEKMEAVPYDQCVYAPLYRNPKRIFGIGLNYVDHAGDIGTAAPQGFPGSFFKMADTLIGPGDEIKTPACTACPAPTSSPRWRPSG